jgi:hypothetical protein
MIGETSRILISCFSAISNQHASNPNNQPPRISWTIHCIIGWNTRQLIPRWIPQTNAYIATSWRQHIIIIMSDHIGPVIKKIRKTNTEDLDTFISRFDELAAQAGNAISDPLRRLDSVDINSAFLNALEYSDIPGEDWGMFPTGIGDKYLTANPRQIYADARVYYSSHFVRKRLEQATAAAIAAASIKPIAVGLDEDSPRVLAIDKRDNRDNCTMRARGRGRGRRGLQPKEYPTDPDGYCTFDNTRGIQN